jgi:hypothetical protein
VCVGLQNNMDLGQTVPSVCSATCLTVSAGGSEVSDIREEEVLHTQEEEEDPLAIALPTVTAADTVCCVCNVVVLTVLQDCTVASVFCQCVVWCSGVTLLCRRRQCAACGFSSLSICIYVSTSVQRVIAKKLTGLPYMILKNKIKIFDIFKIR